MSMPLEALSEINVDTVVGASGFAQKTSEAPSSVTIVGRRQIQEHANRTLADILSGVRGFYVTRDRGYRFLGVRGFSRPGDFGGRVLVALDGHRLNDGIFDTAAIGMDFILDVDLIDRVEVIRGPGSSLYGNNAFFGVVNVIPRTGESFDGVEVSGSVGSVGAYGGRVSYGKKAEGGVDFVISGSVYSNDGNSRLYFPEFVAEGLDGERAPSVYATVSFGEFTIQGGWVDRKKDWPTAAYGTVPNSQDPRFFTEDQRGYLSIKYEHELAGGWLINARGFYDYYSFRGNYPYDYDENTATKPEVNLDLAAYRSAGVEVIASRNFLDRHRVTAGTDFRRNFEQSQSNMDVGTGETYLDRDDTASVFAIFAQDEVRINEQLLLNAGIRYDRYETFGGTINPRAALIYNPRKETALKLIYGQAFRAPNAYELSYESPQARPNPNLDAEKIRSIEVVWEQTINENLRASVSAFRSDINDLIELRAIPNSAPVGGVGDLVMFDNTSSARSQGLDLELAAAFKNGLQAIASYTYSDARNETTNRRLDNSPRHVAKVGVTAPVWQEKVFAGLEVQSLSSRTTAVGSSTGSYTVVNFTVFSRELVKGLQLTGGIYNLLDTSYRDPVSEDFFYTGPISGETVTLDTIRRDGRGFMLKIVSRF